MKKILAIIICLSFALGGAVVLSGCKKNNQKSSNSTENVLSNGGISVKNGNTLYFLNTTTEAASIYTVELNENGEFSSTPKVFVKNVIGNENGSLHIFGDYLYYVAASTDKNSAGEVQSGVIKFCRKPLDGGKSKVIYSTQSSDEKELKYAYYKQGEKDLFLVVYEGNEKTITSVEVGSNPTKKVIATDVASVLLSENGNTEGANKYVYYTKISNRKITNNLMDIQGKDYIERISPDGSNKKTLTSSATEKDYSLVAIADEKLIYSDSSYIFACDGESAEGAKVLSYLPASTYKQIEYFGNKILVLASVENDSTTEYQLWELSFGDNNEMQKIVVNNSMKSDTRFLLCDDEKLYYLIDDKIYSISIAADQNAKELTDVSADEISGNTKPEVVGEYLYFMHTEDDVASIYRIKLNVDEETDAAKLIG